MGKHMATESFLFKAFSKFKSTVKPDKDAFQGTGQKLHIKLVCESNGNCSFFRNWD